MTPLCSFTAAVVAKLTNLMNAGLRKDRHAALLSVTLQDPSLYDLINPRMSQKL